MGEDFLRWTAQEIALLIGREIHAEWDVVAVHPQIDGVEQAIGAVWIDRRLSATQRFGMNPLPGGVQIRSHVLILLAKRLSAILLDLRGHNFGIIVESATPDRHAGVQNAFPCSLNSG